MRDKVGPLLVALGTLSAASYAAAVPLAGWLALAPMALHLGMFAFLFALYLAALRAAARARTDGQMLVIILGFALLFRLLMLPTPVYLSSDPYRYLWDGRVQLAGINPYRYAPAAPELAFAREAAIHPHINRPAAPTVYPPAAQWLFALAAASLPTTIAGWRLLLLACEAATVALLLGWLRRLNAPATAVVAYAWAPIVVFEGAQAGHLDVAVIPLILLALALRQAGSSVGAGIVLGVAILTKLYPVIFLPVWWRRADWNFPVATGATVALGYLPYAASLGWAALGFLPEYLARAEDHNIGLRALVEFILRIDGDVGRGILLGAFFLLLLAALIGIGRRRGEGTVAWWRASFLATGAYLALVPTSMHPWYVVLMVPFLCTNPSPPWLFFTGAVTLSYAKYLVEPAPFPWWVWAGQYLPLYALLLAAWYRSSSRRLGVGVSPRAV
ncbi:MAG: glycosyltransferase 87 family protein [Candidatus Rokuibacteriota bacterium]